MYFDSGCGWFYISFSFLYSVVEADWKYDLVTRRYLDLFFPSKIPSVNKYLIPIKGIKETQPKPLSLESIIYSSFLFKVLNI